MNSKALSIVSICLSVLAVLLAALKYQAGDAPGAVIVCMFTLFFAYVIAKFAESAELDQKRFNRMFKGDLN